MYALTKGNTNKLLVKTRRGISQKFENLETQPSQKNKDGTTGQPEVSSPKPVFHLNGKRSQQQKSPQESISPQHEEMIRYIHETWKCVKNDYEQASSKGVEPNSSQCNLKVPKVCYYTNKSSSSSGLANFEPFDLETFWGQRLFQNITKAAN